MPSRTFPARTGPPDMPRNDGGPDGRRAVQLADQQAAQASGHGQDGGGVLVGLQMLLGAVLLDVGGAGDLAAEERLAAGEDAEPHGGDRAAPPRCACGVTGHGLSPGS
ncbi:hypothetical protein [Streptomyces sp. NPDC059970]|uniref:hypothetical protein n=1 Tax=Streptomyces sp. NPDC059970 TaxID=3347019 RepID=UPI00369C43AA